MPVLPRPYDPGAPVIVIDIGNSTTKIARWQQDQLTPPLSAPTEDAAAVAKAFSAHAEECPDGSPAAVILASVVPPALERARGYVAAAIDQEALVVGDSIPLPMDVGVNDPRAIGADRVCACAAAFDRLQAACIVVDFGTAVTVDLVDDGGTLLGGAIMPGLRLQLQALHQQTAGLPDVPIEIPEQPFGRNTVEAIQTGVVRGTAGAVRSLVEAYATSLNCWPQVLGTGGDVMFMSPHCDFLDTAVQNLTLRGIGLAYSKHLAAQGA